MTSGALGSLFAVWAVSVCSPGPDVAVVLQRSLASRRAGLAAAAGVVTGISVWLIAAFSGVAALVRVHPQVMVGMQVAGGILLAWLGLSGLRAWWVERSGTRAGAESRAESRAETTGDGPAVTTPDGGRECGDRLGRSLRRDYLRGLGTNLANPKALVFIGAILTPFLGGDLSVASSVAIVAGMVAVAALWFAVLATAASHPRVNTRISRALPWIDLGVAVLFVLLGVGFAVAALA